MSTSKDNTPASRKNSDLSNNSNIPAPLSDSDGDDDDNSIVSQPTVDENNEEENKDIDTDKDNLSDQDDFKPILGPYALDSMASHSFVPARHSPNPLTVQSNETQNLPQLSHLASGRQGLISQISRNDISEPIVNEIELTSHTPSQSALLQEKDKFSLQANTGISEQVEIGDLPSASSALETSLSDQEPPEKNRVWFRRRTSTAVNHYANLENTQGFVGAIAIAFAAIPAPKSLMAAGNYFFDNENKSFYSKGEKRSEPRPTAAAHIKFKREHTRRQIFKRRLKIFGFLIKEYLKLFGKYVMTLRGFAVTLYFMLVIAFGGMLFLLLCNAAPAMTREWGPDDKEHSPRQIWMEIDSQILNALFSITGLGLFPIRMRDLYLWFRGRYQGDLTCNVRILKIHSKWFWSGFSSDWKLMTVIVLYIFNSVFQVLLCFVMWNYNRFTRPSWTTGTLIAASFSCTIGAGIIMFLEAKRIDKYCFQTGNVRIQGIPFDEMNVKGEVDYEAKDDNNELQTVNPRPGTEMRASVRFPSSNPLLLQKTQKESAGGDASNLV
jgi:hypothetical protein